DGAHGQLAGRRHPRSARRRRPRCRSRPAPPAEPPNEPGRPERYSTSFHPFPSVAARSFRFDDTIQGVAGTIPAPLLVKRHYGTVGTCPSFCCASRAALSPGSWARVEFGTNGTSPAVGSAAGRALLVG